MPVQRYTTLRVWSIAILIFCLGVVTTACFSSSSAEVDVPEGLHTWLLVRAPDRPLALNQPVDVRSRTEDAQNGISHVELYAVELPTGQSEVLLRADAAPFQQTSYTASQIFVPKQVGHYAIKVVGYNRIGEKAVSETISFDVVQ